MVVALSVPFLACSSPPVYRESLPSIGIMGAANPRGVGTSCDIDAAKICYSGQRTWIRSALPTQFDSTNVGPPTTVPFAIPDLITVHAVCHYADHLELAKAEFAPIAPMGAVGRSYRLVPDGKSPKLMDAMGRSYRLVPEGNSMELSVDGVTKNQESYLEKSGFCKRCVVCADSWVGAP
jgi:hypothetical protein